MDKTSKTSLPWKIYFFLFVPFPVTGLLGITLPQGTVYSYHHVMMAFDKSYAMIYWLNVTCAVVNVLSLVPFFLFVFQKRFLYPKAWQYFFIARIIFELTGHAYETNVIKSLIFTDLWIAASSLFISFAVILPSYIAGFLYAFRSEKIFS